MPPVYAASLRAMAEADGADLIASHPDLRAAERDDFYVAASGRFAKRRAVLVALAAHGARFGDSLAALRALATTDEPDRAEAAARRALSGLVVLSTALGGPVAGGVAAGAAGVAGDAAGVAARAYLSRRIDRRIAEDQEVVDAQIALHAQALEALRDQIEADLERAAQERDVQLRLAFSRAAAPSDDWLDRWIAARLRTDAEIAAALAAAAEALDKLRAAWGALAPGAAEGTAAEAVGALDEAVARFRAIAAGLKELAG